VKEKYEFAQEWVSNMIKSPPRDRPDCEKIFEKRFIWGLNCKNKYDLNHTIKSSGAMNMFLDKLKNFKYSSSIHND
jgi:hypothetical protein